jgi:hypothetical protein
MQITFFESTPVTLPDCTQDGITHINIYSRGKTELGRLLSNFAHTPFTTKNHGSFASVEGFYYWLKSGMTDDYLRTLYGFEAKKYGKILPIVNNPNFDNICKQAIGYKYEQNANVRRLLYQSSLPFEHYYEYGGKVVMGDDKWCGWWDELRNGR